MKNLFWFFRLCITKINGRVSKEFLHEGNFGLQLLSLPASVSLCVHVAVCLCVYQSRACPHDNSPLVEAKITKFGVEVQKTLIKVPIALGVHLNAVKIPIVYEVIDLDHQG